MEDPIDLMGDDESDLDMGDRNDVVGLGAAGRISYNIGGTPGPIYHPAWYVKQYKLKLEPWEKTHNQTKGKRA